jgi:hypothetical protein
MNPEPKNTRKRGDQCKVGLTHTGRLLQTWPDSEEGWAHISIRYKF